MDKRYTHRTEMKIKALVFIFLYSCMPNTAYSAFPPDYSAIYYVDKLGTTVGRSTIALNTTDSEIHYSQNVELVGFISFFKKDRVSENSWISKNNNDFLLKKYQYVHSNSNKNRDSLLEATWESDKNCGLTGEITGNTRGKTVSLKTNEPVWDTLSFQLALMNDISNKNETYTYNVISRGEIKQYIFTNIGEEIIEINDRQHKTIKLERRSGNKATKIWLATEKFYVPVLIEQYKDDDLDSTMTLDSVTLNSASAENEED